MQRLLGMLALIAGAASCSMAAITTAPEIDPATGGSAIALVTGALLIVRGRKK